MTRSMTAFADGEAEWSQLTLICELRSVNHRYCDVSLKLPERLRYLESDARRLIAEKIKRGKIECAIGYKKQSNSPSFSINEDAVQNLIASAHKIEKLMFHSASYSALEVLAFPGIQQETEIDKQELRDQAMNLLEHTLTQFLQAREREGAQLAQLIRERCDKIRQLVIAAQQRMPEVLQQQREKLINRVQELVAEPNMDRLEQELLILAQKMDVAEELDRLNTHVTEVSRALNQSEPIGRRLDFLMQEMNREANTLGSKSADRTITQISIDLKVLIEQMREQIQNIE
jgi:uncharacterized protein (TIGR00255 family)